MTTPLEKKIEKVLVKVYNNGFDARKVTDLEPFDMMTVDEAKTAILQLLTETVQEAVPEKMGEGLQPLYSKGYNTAVDQTTTNLNRILGGDE